MADQTDWELASTGGLRPIGQPIYSTGRKRRNPSHPPSLCIIDGCEGPAKARGWCNRHYVRFIKHGDPLAGGSDRPAKGEVAATLAAALAFDKDECFTWPHATNGFGYGQVVVDGEKQLVHRYVCAQIHGPPPTVDSQSAHSCGKGHESCTAPRHLSWKLPIDNIADQVVHGTAIRGSRVGSAKLSEQDVFEIRRKLSEGAMQRDIAAEFGLSQCSISMIATGKNWRWLTKKVRAVEGRAA